MGKLTLAPADLPERWAKKEAEIAKLRAEIERLRASLKECADDLERTLKRFYGMARFDYPEVRQRYNFDMEPVAKARRLLTQG